MGVKAHAVVVLTTTALVACSTFTAPADACGHTYCADFEKPLAAPWSFQSNPGATGTIKDGHYDVQVAGGQGEGAMLYLRLNTPVTKMTCGVTITITTAPSRGDIFLAAVGAADPAPDTYVGVSVSPSRLEIAIGRDAPATTAQIAVGTPTRLAVEVEGNGTNPALTRDADRTSTPDPWTHGKLNNMFFGLKPNDQSTAPTDAWAATFDDAWCDVIE